MANFTHLTRSNYARVLTIVGERHPELGSVLAQHGAPALRKRAEGYATLVRIILEQQISVQAANSIFRRLRSGLGHVSARRVADAGERQLQALGLTRQKARYCHALAVAIRKRQLSLAALAGQDDRSAIAALVAQPGIGPWTAGIYLMNATGRADIWPPGDLALERSIDDLVPARQRAAAKRDGARWQPYRSAAALILWQHYRHRNP